VVSDEKLFEYPHKISCELLAPFLRNGVLVMDAGCGTNSRLGEMVINRGAKYLGVDNGRVTYGKTGPSYSNIESLKRDLERKFWRRSDASLSLYDSDINSGLPEVPVADVVHVRFLLRDVQPAERISLLQKLRPKARLAMVFLEEDWSVFGSTSKYANHVDNLKEYVTELMAKLGRSEKSLFLGKHLPATVEKAYSCGGVEGRVFDRPDGGDLSDLVAFSEVYGELAHKNGFVGLANHLRDVKGAFEYFQQKSVPIFFTPPNICAVVVRF
jgi:hypothetical protein